jgi:16S rRNA A1518/A1519 N6-dimethyltransferase RsmA/KsgA/DIM1 with predicted DNA glycosylase/AP lyase activity
MALCKADFIVNQYTLKLRLPNKFNGNLSYQISTKFVERLMEYRKRSVSTLM